MAYIKTYVRGLDEQIHNGIKEGSVILVAGGSGSMKSSLVYNILHNYVKFNEGRAVYLSLEQERDTLMEQMRGLGMLIEETKEGFAVIDIGVLRRELEGYDEENIDWFTAIKTQIKKYKENIDFEILAIDSLDALYVISQMKNPRNDLFHFFGELRKLKLTTFLITEMPKGTDEYGKYGVESFLADVLYILHWKEQVEA